MAQQQQGYRVKAAWTIWDFTKLRLAGVPWVPGDYKQVPSLITKVVNGNPRFLLYLNHPGSKPNGLPVAFDPAIFGMLTEALLLITEKAEADKITMAVKATYENGIKLDKPKVVSTVTVGRNTDGIIYLAIHIKGEPQAEFHFLPSFFAELLGADGEKLNRATASTLAAKGWVNMITKMVYTYITLCTKEPPKREAPAPSYGESYGSGGGYNTNTEQRPAIASGGFDDFDDIPF